MSRTTSADRWQLRRPQAAPERAAPATASTRPPLRRGTLLIGVGNSGEAVCQRVQGHAWRDGFDLRTLGVNNDRREPPPLFVAADGRAAESVTLSDRLVLGAEGNARDQIRDYPLLVERYLERGLLRGIPVFESYNRSIGRGGSSFPAISAMDIDLNIEALVAFLRRALQELGSRGERRGGASDLEALLSRVSEQRAVATEFWTIVLVGGGAGSCGNAGLQLLPYLLRHLLADMGLANYELWGVVLGPRAFTGLTPHVQLNYLALLHGLEHQATHGSRRRYLNGLEVGSDAPPFDRLFLLDDPRLPAERAAVTESELEGFLDRSALGLHLLLHTEAHEALASHTANPLAAPLDTRIRWLHTLGGSVAGVERATLERLVQRQIEARLLEQFVARLAA